ncbi:hypothetical protein PYV02_00225 [Leifsonia sp. H3M29-4]|uniref:LamG-like jellyroll fold domain-containing protein n=1 Tax=Salinibacterium metalliresistens TaxID=3031321 RepID=UPI0023D98DB4|nr:LamG-like jellyroll fold domain-containing protein [Salinibacterium metalliresistens]MDF1477502.1 hypothetical protein [Salinibacterium metalliresistens]
MPTARPRLSRATAILAASAVILSGGLIAASAQAAVDPETLTFEQLGAPLPTADLLDADFEGGAIVDHSGYARTFTSGAPSIAQDAELGVPVATIAQTTAAAFATTWTSEDYAKTGDGFTIETVFRMDTELASGYRDIFSGMEKAGFGLEVTNSSTAGREHLSLYAHNGEYREARASDALEVGRWYHIAGSYDGASLKLYLDGALVASTAMTGAVLVPASAAQKMVIGGDVSSTGGIQSPANGSIALARIYDQPLGELDVHRLSRAEVLALDTMQPLVKAVSDPATTAAIGVEYSAPDALAVDDGRPVVSTAISVVTPDGTDVALTATGGPAVFTPEVAGSYTLRYSAVDAAGNLGTREYSVTVADPGGEPTDPEGPTDPTEPVDPQEPHVSFGAIGDIHDSWTELRETYDFYDTLGLDATLFVGDLTNNGTASEYNGIKQVIDERQGDRALVAALGNHDTYSGIQDYDLFRGATGLAPNADYEINGYHFIAVSPGAGTLDESTGKPSVVNSMDYAYATPWLESRLAADTAEHPDRPVFILVHAPIRCTHYTSNLWYGSGVATGCGDGFDSLLEDYPQAVVWSGHNHTPNNIPTSIWQGTETGGGFTSVNAPSMATMYIDPAANGGDDTPNDAGDNRQTAVVEVTGSVVTIRSYDLLGDNWIDQTWTWDVADSLDPELDYPERFPLGDARALATSGPLWTGGATVALTGLTETAVTLTHPQAVPAPNDVQDITYYYRYELVNQSTGARVQNVTQASGFYVTPLPATRSKTFTGLVAGTQYQALITPYNAWGKAGVPLTQSFTTAGGDPDGEPQAPGGAVLSTTTRAVTPGIPLAIAFTDPASKSSATNKVAVYKAATCEGTPVAWAYTNSGTQTAGTEALATGTVSFATANWTYGSYTACLLHNDQAAPAGVIGDRLPLTAVAVTSDTSTVVVGQPITFRFGATTDRLSRTNWIGVYNKSSCSSPSTKWMYLNSGTQTAGSTAVQSGTRTFSTSGWAAGTTQKVCLVYNDTTGNFIGSAFTINVVAAAPTPAPVIAGTPTPGQTLTAMPGSGWSLTDPTYAYQWKADGVDIPGATARTLELGSAFPVGTAITVAMTATSGALTESATTPAVTVSVAHSISLSADSVEHGTPFTVDYSTTPANALNWIGIYSVDQGEPGTSASLAWEYAPNATGSITFSDVLPVGRYRVEFLYNDGYMRLVTPLTLTVTEPTGPTDPTDPEPTPVPDSVLDGAPRGGVMATPSITTPGEQLVVTVGAAQAGHEVRIWLHSTPTLLGSYVVSSAGNVTVTLPAGVAAGSHRLVVQALDGSLIGWTAIEVKGLAYTGTDIRGPVGLALALLLFGTIALLVVGRRRAAR